MIEAEARRLLRDCDGFGGLETWIAAQPWQKVPGEGWSVTRALQGQRFRIEPIPAGLRLRAWPPGGGAPAVWRVAAPA